MVATAGGVAWMTTSSAFRLGTPEGDVSLSYADAGQVLAAAGLEPGAHPNVVLLRTDEMRNEMMSFPAIADANVQVVLPDRVIVSLQERQPVFALRRPDATYLVSEDGLVLATVDAGRPAQLGLPSIEDDRTQSAPDVKIGGQLDEIDLTAMLELGALTPALVDSTATGLALSVGDDNGYVLIAQPQGWQAVFGEYTPTLRPLDLIPRQVQCLRSLVAASESDLRTIYLAPLDERCGTYLPNATAVPVVSPAPSRSR
jgi:hypothetical protein